ncbi:nucleoside hydrolase [Amycolatopsis tucumanensis]|uniref:Nucleoside hydrolase n=1 Tax=Amycolatopsis tucumanensis TaxID=401106 RepID=A0ABP7HKE0_9PSEU|nr:nucleoside hydrolase [Amycolatopsis tucumanensis]MCF6420750.1 nucleoside hydrolase [Amycolatopsis tucumanensis]
MRTVLLTVVLVIAGLAAPAAPSAAPRPVPVIYDSDLDVDDASTLAYLCVQHQERRIDLRAVTITNNGFGTPGRARQHAHSVLRQCGLPDVPVADGSGTGVHPAPAATVRDMETVLTDALGDAGQTPPPAKLTAAHLIRKTLATTTTKVTVLSTGPLSNLATALPAGSPLIRQVRDVHVMGGAVHVGGNLFGEALPGFDNSQELNIWLDPPAAREVFRALPVTLTPLDATDSVPITQAYVDRIGAEGTTVSARVVHAIMTHPIMRDGIALGWFFWWDALAAVFAFGDDGVVTEVTRVRLVVIQDGPSSGRTAPDPRGDPVTVALGADGGRFEQVFLDGLNGRG